MSGYDPTLCKRLLADATSLLAMRGLAVWRYTSGFTARFGDDGEDVVAQLGAAIAEVEQLKSENYQLGTLVQALKFDTDERARLALIEAAAIKWRHAMCVSPDCGDGKLLHAYDCPALVAKRDLIAAIDANSDMGSIECVARQCPTCTLPIDDDGCCSVTCPRSEPEPCCEHRCKNMAEHFARSGDIP